MNVSSAISGTARRRKSARKPINLGVAGGIVLMPVLMPVLMIAAVVSIPYTWVWRAITKRKEQRFAERMKSVGRLKAWDEVEGFLHNGKGTFIAESLSLKGPSRLWWTTDKISQINPFPFVSSEKRDRVCYEMEFRPFGNWCFHTYTSPRSGRAFLVEIPVEETRELWKTVTTSGCISTYSRKARTA